MTQTIDKPILGLGNTFPDNLFLIGVGEKFMCYCFDSMHGISCFEVKENAEKYRDDLSKDIPGGVVTQYTFDEARDIAKSKPPTVGLFLQDDMNNIKIHFVR